MKTIIIKLQIGEGETLPARITTIDEDGKVKGYDYEILERPTDYQIIQVSRHEYLYTDTREAFRIGYKQALKDIGL
jgi:hypothetical protein